MAVLNGIDIASHQHPNGADIDWQRVVNAGYTFAFIKITEGRRLGPEGYSWYTNPFFLPDWNEANRVGMVRGMYHFARPQSNDPKPEVDHFISRFNALSLPRRKGDMIVLDLEDEDVPVGVSLFPWVYEWKQAVKNITGITPILYTRVGYMQEHDLINHPEIEDMGLWLADYDDTWPIPPRPWNVVAFWQYTEKGQVPGISTNVDLNYFNGDDPERLMLYGWQQPVTPPAPSPAQQIIDRIKRDLNELEKLIG